MTATTDEGVVIEFLDEDPETENLQIFETTETIAQVDRLLADQGIILEALWHDLERLQPAAYGALALDLAVSDGPAAGQVRAWDILQVARVRGRVQLIHDLGFETLYPEFKALFNFADPIWVSHNASTLEEADLITYGAEGIDPSTVSQASDDDDIDFFDRAMATAIREVWASASVFTISDALGRVEKALELIDNEQLIPLHVFNPLVEHLTLVASGQRNFWYREELCVILK